MKKLTAGIFATILGVTAMGAADAAVTSKGYVDAAINSVKGQAGEVAADLEALTGRVSTAEGKITTAEGEIDALQAADTTLQGNIDAVSAVANAAATKTEMTNGLALKADKTFVGDLPAGTTASTVVGFVEEKTANIASDARVKSIEDTMATYGDIVTHDADEFATAAQGATADTTAATVATYGDIVTHDAADFATAAQGAKADTAVQPAAINDMATKTWVGEQNYVDETELAGKGYLTSTSLTDYATKTEAQGYADAKDTAISAAQTAADEAKAALNTASKLSDGQYALTMKVVDGVTTYGWELIDREYVETDVTPNGQ